MGDKGREEKALPTLYPGGLSFDLMDTVCRNERASRPKRPEDKGSRGSAGRRRGVVGARHCAGAPPLYLFQSLLGLGLPCLWGPGSSVGSVTSAVVMLMEPPCPPPTGGTPALASPHQLLGRIPAPIPSGRGQSVGPEPNPRQQPPFQSEPTAKCTFQAQAVTFLSPKLQKRNEI